MKLANKLLFGCWVILVFGACSLEKGRISNLELEKGFVHPPDSIQTGVYWYWISDNVTKEGVEKDLESMKEAGINRAFIGNIGQSDIPYGSAKIFSDEWWDILHAALKKATELNIEIGIFNSPGWSQSGGPWVKPTEAMRYLTTSELQVEGPQKISHKLVKPVDPFQDESVIAYLKPKYYNQIFDTKAGTITSSPKVAGLYKITDKDVATGIHFPANGDFVINFESKIPFTVRSLSITPLQEPINNLAILQVKERDGRYRSICEFQIDRFNASLNTGFEPYAPVVGSFEAVTANSFRIVIKDINTTNGLAEVELSPAPRIERYPEKTLAKMHQTPLPY